MVAPKKQAGTSTKLGVAAAGAAFAAAAIFRRRRMAAEAPHPLAGSLAKRVENFEKFVELPSQKKFHTSSGDMGDDYSAMPDTAAMV